MQHRSLRLMEKSFHRCLTCCSLPDVEGMPTFGVFSISGESHESKQSAFCALCTEGKALAQHLELITCVSQLTGGQQARAAPAPADPYIKHAHGDLQLQEA